MIAHCTVRCRHFVVQDSMKTRKEEYYSFNVTPSGFKQDINCISNGILLKQSGRLHSEDCSTPREEKEKAPVQESALLQDRLRVAAHCRRNERKPHAMFDLDCTNLLSPFLAPQDTGYLWDF